MIHYQIRWPENEVPNFAKLILDKAHLLSQGIEDKFIEFAFTVEQWYRLRDYFLTLFAPNGNDDEWNKIPVPGDYVGKIAGSRILIITDMQREIKDS